MSITQNGERPYTMRCSACGAVWVPSPARGQREVTDNRLDTEVKEHWAACPGRLPSRP